MSEFGRRVGSGDMLKATYDANKDGIIDQVIAHQLSHRAAGTDEINAAGLTGRINYVDRGDPAGYDYTQATITTDGDWHDLDLSSIVPAGATAIYLKVTITDDLLATNLAFRKKGNTNNFANRMVRTQEANIAHGELFFVPCNAGRVIEYKGTNTGFLGLNITVLGWLI